MEDWIQETCLISAVTSGPTEPKTFQEAWHSPIEKERDNWRAPINLIPLNKICAHITSGSQSNQVSLFDSLASQYPPDPGENVLKRSATATGEQDFPVKWFKFIHPSPKPRMTETPVKKPVHVAYSPIASMNYQWTINLHDRYPLLQGMQPEEYIPPSLHTLCNHKPTMFHLGDDFLCPSKILLPAGDNGENLEAASNRKNDINDDRTSFSSSSR